MQTGHSVNHRRVKCAASESESYEADFNHGRPSSRKVNAKEYRTFEFQAEGFFPSLKLLERSASLRMTVCP
jgi:hypothetical protein